MARQIPGKFVWYELVTPDAQRAQAFYGEVLGWKTQSFPMGDFSYDMVFVGDGMIGGYARPTRDDEPSHWIACVSVTDVDASARSATENGGMVLEPPLDIPHAGRRARIADPQGAELYLFKREMDDPPDGPAPLGAFCWNELYTPDPRGAVAFYEKVVGFAHVERRVGPESYYILSAGGEDRGGVTHHLPPGVPAHWLPYVHIDDADAATARAQQSGGTVHVQPADIPGVGRFGVVQDPTGALLAVLKPLPPRGVRRQP